MKIVIDVSDVHEATSYPWWMIVDPGKMWEGTVNGVADMVTGPYFSRAAAEEYLRSHRHEYSDRATVYCDTGHRSPEYVRAFKEAEQAAWRQGGGA
jgi:rhodanese-related sulfurtransferase